MATMRNKVAQAHLKSLWFTRIYTMHAKLRPRLLLIYASKEKFRQRAHKAAPNRGLQ